MAVLQKWMYVSAEQKGLFGANGTENLGYGRILTILTTDYTDLHRFLATPWNSKNSRD